MSGSFLLYIVFASQIFIISYLLPNKLRKRAIGIMADYPPENYAKLYPISVDKIKKKISQLMMLTKIVLAIGLGIIAFGLYNQSSEMLGWDSQSVITVYYMLQIAPLVMLALFSERYFKKMRCLNKNTIRKANLAPRRLSNYAPKAFIGLAIGMYLAFVALVFYVNNHPFDGFAGGFTNILGVTGLNIFFGVFVYRAIYGKKKDPHLDDEDRFKQTSREVQLMLFGSIAATLNISIHFLLSSMDLRHLNDVVSSVYYQVLMLVVIMMVVKEGANFDVYKEQPDAEGEMS